MKIIEHRLQPGTISFLHEEKGKRTYWFHARNLFDIVMDDEQAVDLILQWSETEVEQEAKPFLADEANWTEYQPNHEIEIAPHTSSSE